MFDGYQSELKQQIGKHEGGNKLIRRKRCGNRKIMRLEEKLGVSLLERSNIGVRLTNAGQRYLDEVQPALQQLGQARRAAHSAGRAMVNTAPR